MTVTHESKERGKILDEIMAHHREQLPKVKRNIQLSDVQALAMVSPPAVDFYAALAADGVSLIAECKKASPSKGVMAQNYDPVAFSKMYADAGASAISVLTDQRYFQGNLSHLRDVKEVLPKMPVLRKDFTFDPYQIYEARAAGADAILLIAAVLETSQMKELLEVTHLLGMNALVEVHTEEELKRALEINPRIVGVNNRNLQTFEVDFENTARLREMIPEGVLAVGESGLKTEDDVRIMRDMGIDAILVGETLVKSSQPSLTARRFVAAGRR